MAAHLIDAKLRLVRQEIPVARRSLGIRERKGD
jgi:hypothetical protein